MTDIIQEHLPFGESDNSFQSAGREQGLRQLVEDFYHFMDILPEAKAIRDMHSEDLDDAIERLSLFLCGWLGGPRHYQARYGSIRIPPAHSHLPINEIERDAWLLCMEKALERQPYSQNFKTYMLEQLFVPAERIRIFQKT